MFANWFICITKKDIHDHQLHGGYEKLFLVLDSILDRWAISITQIFCIVFIEPGLERAGLGSPASGIAACNWVNHIAVLSFSYLVDNHLDSQKVMSKATNYVSKSFP